MESWRRTSSIVVLAIALVVVVAAGEEKAIDKEACREQRLGMATCLPYMKGNARSPTPDCCSSLKQIVNSDKNCICVIIQDRNDPDLGLQNQINTSLAFTLPSICHVIVNVTKCPALLHLDPNSPEAQVFYELAKAINKIGPASAPTGSAPEPTREPDHIGNSGRSPTSSPGKSHAQSFRKRWLRLEVVFHFCVILYILSY